MTEARCTNETCAERHCACQRHLAWGDYTCPTCVGNLRRNLREVEDLATFLTAEAEVKGVESTAAMLAGPTTDPTRWVWRLANERRAQREAGVPFEERIDEGWDMLHPHTALGRWERELREEFEQDSEVLSSAKLSESRAYLDGAVARLARSEDHVLVFVELADDVRSLRRHLEGVLRDGEQVDRGTECPMCGEARLELNYGAAKDWDRWKCPRCGTSYTDHDYRSKVAAVYVQHADRLTASQIEDTYRVKPGTLRAWASGDQPKVRKRGKDASGRVLYDVSDTLAMRDRLSAGMASATGAGFVS